MRKKISNILTVAVILVTFSLAVLTYLPRLMGYHGYYVDSFSMEPSISYGDLILTKPVAFEEVRVHDVLTFQKEDSSARFSHRVIQIDKNEKSFITKGDHNNVQDPLSVPYDLTVGRVEKVIPYVGFVSMFLHTSAAKVVVPLLYIIYAAIEIEIYQYRKKKGRNEE